MEHLEISAPELVEAIETIYALTLAMEAGCTVTIRPNGCLVLCLIDTITAGPCTLTDSVRTAVKMAMRHIKEAG